MTHQPMLAGKADLATLRYPLLVAPKLDGVRCLAKDMKPMSRSMKVLPNLSLQRVFREQWHILAGLDGELIVGEPTADDCYRRTESVVMSQVSAGGPINFWVFDRWDQASDVTFEDRLSMTAAPSQLWSGVKVVPHTLVRNTEELLALEERYLEGGYEGVMLRNPLGPYKRGRCTTREGWLLKLKRHEDDEAEIIGFKELMHNGNEAFTSELGRTKRSTHQAGKSGLDALGAFVCRGVTGRFRGVEFDVGGSVKGSLRAEDRRVFWQRRETLLGKIIKYQHFPIGVKERPRHPGFLGFRDPRDM